MSHHNRGGRERGSFNSNHNTFGAYGGGNRGRDAEFPRLPPGNFNRNDLPELPPQPSFVTSSGQFGAAYQAIQREQQRRAIEQQVRQAIIAEQDKSRWGIKSVTLDDDEDDPDIVPMGHVSSIFEPQPPPPTRVEIHYIEKSRKRKKKDKKHRKRHHSSDEESNEESEAGTSSSKRKKKHRRDRDQSDEEEAANDAEEMVKQRRLQLLREEISRFDVSRNPWVLLRKGEYVYHPGHMVVDRRADRANITTYDHPYPNEVPLYHRIIPQGAALKDIHAISENHKELTIVPEIYAMDMNKRFFSDRVLRGMNQFVERHFRTVKGDIIDYVELSHQPDEANMNLGIDELKQEDTGWMDINDFAHYVESRKLSPEEAKINNIDGQFSVLQTRVNMNKNDVKAWIEFIEIQRPYHAKNESGNPNAPIKNEKAYYERVMEIIRRAINHNQSSAELQLKKLQALEEHFGSIDDEEVRKAWQWCENRFVNNISLWEGMLKMRINNRTTFELEAILKDINRAIEKLVNVKIGVIKTHKPVEGTDEFLIDLLVTRFRLLISTGFIDRAIGMMQALAEFHFFRPEHLDVDEKENLRGQLEQARSEFKHFWNCGAKRIGEEAAEGWCLLSEEGYKERDEWKRIEADALEHTKTEFQPDENKEMEQCRNEGKLMVEARKVLDGYRTQCFWAPLHFFHDAKLHDYDHRIIGFREIQPLLFPMENVELLREMIYKMLHLLGVPIPGLKFNSQEDILGAFSTIFASTRPNTMKLHMFEKFITDFIGLIACSNKMDEKRIYTGILTCISNSSEKISTKIEKLKAECRRDRTRTVDSQELDIDVKLPFWVCALEEIARLQAEPSATKKVKDDTYVMEMSLNLLSFNLDDVKPFWEIGVDQPQLRYKRLFHLRFAANIVRKLPFSDADNANESVTLSLKRRKTKLELRSKRGFLLSFWATGKVAPVEETQENIDAAWTRVTDQLKSAAPRDQADLQYRWVGNQYELIFELAALFCYEFPRNPLDNYKFFVHERPLFTSELAKSLKDSAAVQEMRIGVLQHMMHISKGNQYTPGDLSQMLEHQMESFPHSIFLLHTYLSVANGMRQRNFLYRNPGKDPLTRLIRDCGQLYKEQKELITSLEKSEKAEEEARRRQEEGLNDDDDLPNMRIGKKDLKELPLNDKEKKRMMAHWVRVVRKIAEDHSDNLVPDDYIWCNLMFNMVIGKREVGFAAIDEVFAVGQKVCPWSKQFLFEAAISQATFLSTLNSSMNKHKLCAMCNDEEVRLFMTQIVA